MTAQERVLYSVPEAAQRLSLGRSQVYELIRSGALVTVPVGRRRLVPATSLTDYVDQLVQAVSRAA